MDAYDSRRAAGIVFMRPSSATNTRTSWRGVNKILITGHTPNIDGRHQMQHMRCRFIAVQAGGQGHIHIDFLRIHGTGGGAPTQFRTVDAGSGPQQIGQGLLGQRRRLEFTLRLARAKCLHQGHAANHRRGGQMDGLARIKLQRRGFELPDEPQSHFCQRIHLAILLVHMLGR